MLTGAREKGDTRTSGDRLKPEWFPLIERRYERAVKEHFKASLRDVERFELRICARWNFCFMARSTEGENSFIEDRCEEKSLLPALTNEIDVRMRASSIGFRSGKDVTRSSPLASCRAHPAILFCMGIRTDNRRSAGPELVFFSAL